MGGKRNRVLGRCAGILFLTAAVASLPANQLLSAPRPAWWIHLIDLLGALTAPGAEERPPTARSPSTSR